MTGKTGPQFVPASDKDLHAFGADISPLAHYLTYGPCPVVDPDEDARQQTSRRDALGRLIDGAF